MHFFDFRSVTLLTSEVTDLSLCINTVRGNFSSGSIPDEIARDIWHLVSVGTDITVLGYTAEYDNVQLPFLVVPVHNYPANDNCVNYFVVFHDHVVEYGACSPAKVSTFKKFSQFIRENFCAKYGQMPDCTAKVLWDLFGWFGTIL